MHPSTLCQIEEVLFPLFTPVAHSLPLTKRGPGLLLGDLQTRGNNAHSQRTEQQLLMQQQIRCKDLIEQTSNEFVRT